MEDEYWSGLYLEGLQQEDEDNIVRDVMDIDSNVCAAEEIELAPNEQPAEEVCKTIEDNGEKDGQADEDDGDHFAHIDIQGSLQKVTAKTLLALENLYKNHARALGFGVRRGTGRTRGGIESEKYLHCACQGTSTRVPTPVVAQVGKNGKRKGWRRKVPHTRTGCGALARMKLDKEKGCWEVVKHIVEHNHPLTRPEWQYLNRSERAITPTQVAAIETMEKADLKPSVAYRVMVEDAGSVEYVGFTKRDHINYVNKMRMKNLEGGDAQKVVDELAKIAEEDPNFYYRVKLDDDGKLAAIFWRDAMMKEDYILFGDVVVFDTTYNTNRYNLICGPFVGVNNHWNNVMFGCAIICNEKTETFVWVLEKFKQSMGGKVPVSIFTDQDAAIGAAISEVFEETRHRLCLWHIIQNAQSHFGALKSNEEFNAEFEHCLKGCANEEDFEHCWKTMIEKHGLQDHSWLNGLYEFKDKWCTALSKDFFSAGFLSSQRSESTNHAIKFETTRSTFLHCFFKVFQSTVDNWRNAEIEREHRCSQSIAVTSLQNGLLKHAAEKYTLEIFKYFQHEFKASVATSIQIEVWTEELKIFKVAPEEEPDKAETVNLMIENGNTRVLCSCKHFETIGWLCFHALRALHTCNITKIPTEYIITRWTKYAKLAVWDAVYTQEPQSTNLSEITTWKQKMARKCNSLLMQSQGSADARKLIEECIENVLLAVQQILSEEAQDGVAANTSEEAVGEISNVSAVGDHDRTQKKGRPKKITNKFNRRKKLNPEDYEFGSTTPNARLF